METVNVNSSFIRSVSWTPDEGVEDSGTVRITFRDGATFDYSQVSRADFDALASAPSVGKFFHAVWKNRYTGERA